VQFDIQQHFARPSYNICESAGLVKPAAISIRIKMNPRHNCHNRYKS